MFANVAVDESVMDLTVGKTKVPDLTASQLEMGTCKAGALLGGGCTGRGEGDRLGGLTEGTADGYSEGATVVATEGSVEGMSVGDAEGSKVGTLVGTQDGKIVGEYDGSEVGD
jgi:hypothetical protein